MHDAESDQSQHARNRHGIMGSGKDHLLAVCRGKYRSKPACPAVGRVKSGVVGVDGGRLPLRLCCVADSDSVLDGAILCASEGRGCEE